MAQDSIAWEEQGCEECRAAWLQGRLSPVLTDLGTSQYHRATLYRCTACGSFWEELERFAHQVSAEEAKKFFSHDTRT